jgi:hypothetical protein
LRLFPSSTPIADFEQDQLTQQDESIVALGTDQERLDGRALASLPGRLELIACRIDAQRRIVRK